MACCLNVAPFPGRRRSFEYNAHYFHHVSLPCSHDSDAVFDKLWTPPATMGKDSDDNPAATPNAQWYRAAKEMYGGSEKEPKKAFLKKTFQERRTWYQLYRAYFRIFAFHILWFHILMGLAFARDSRAGSDSDSFQGRWWMGISAAVITHLLLSIIFIVAGGYVKAPIPRPPVASEDVRTHVDRPSVLRALCCCLPSRGKDKRKLTPTEEVDQVKEQDWMAPRILRLKTALRQTLVMLGLLALFALLVFVFVAQFQWFPWPDVEEVNGEFVSGLVISGKPAAQFFEECGFWHVALPCPCAVGRCGRHQTFRCCPVADCGLECRQHMLWWFS